MQNYSFTNEQNILVSFCWALQVLYRKKHPPLQKVHRSKCVDMNVTAHLPYEQLNELRWSNNRADPFHLVQHRQGNMDLSCRNLPVSENHRRELRLRVFSRCCCLIHTPQLIQSEPGGLASGSVCTLRGSRTSSRITTPSLTPPGHRHASRPTIDAFLFHLIHLKEDPFLPRAVK